MKSEDITNKMTKHELFHYEARRIFENTRDNGTPLCALCIDIDKFKNINDTFGHDSGDVVIERIMNVLINNSMQINKEKVKHYSMIERDAGDEFKIIVSDNIEVCKKLAQSIIDDVKNIDYKDIAEDLSTSVSIGIASINEETGSCGYLFHLADSALYEAKSKCKGTYLVYEI